MANEEKIRVFMKDLSREVQKLCKTHGIHYAPCNAFLDGEACHVNLTVYLADPNRYYADCFRKHCHSLDINSSWLGAAIIEKQTGMTWTVLGLDPDGGNKPVRIKNTKDQHAHIAIQELKSWMTNNQHI